MVRPGTATLASICHTKTSTPTLATAAEFLPALYSAYALSIVSPRTYAILTASEEGWRRAGKTAVVEIELQVRYLRTVAVSACLSICMSVSVLSLSLHRSNGNAHYGTYRSQDTHQNTVSSTVETRKKSKHSVGVERVEASILPSYSEESDSPRVQLFNCSTRLLFVIFPRFPALRYVPLKRVLLSQKNTAQKNENENLLHITEKAVFYWPGCPSWDSSVPWAENKMGDREAALFPRTQRKYHYCGRGVESFDALLSGTLTRRHNSLWRDVAKGFPNFIGVAGVAKQRISPNVFSGTLLPGTGRAQRE